MKKRMIALMMAAVMGVSLAACGGKTADTSSAQAQEEAAEPAEEAPAEEEKEEPAADAAEAPAAETPAGEATEPAEAEQEAAAAETADGALRLFVLSGPTGIGAMNLWAAADAGETAQAYNITMTGANDEIVAALSKGEADVAAIATNLASTLYNKTEGGISVLAVNTLGVLSILAPAGVSAHGEDLPVLQGDCHAAADGAVDAGDFHFRPSFRWRG